MTAKLASAFKFTYLPLLQIRKFSDTENSIKRHRPRTLVQENAP